MIKVSYWESEDGYDYDIKKEKTNTIYPNKPAYYITTLQDIIENIIDFYNQ
jgi:hypothetical protein